MAQTEFKTKAPQKVSLDAVKKTAAAADERAATFTIPAETGKELTLTGEFFEQAWEKFEDGKKKSSGTTIMVGVKELPQPLRLSFFRARVLREEDGNKEFKACFPRESSFVQMVEGLTKDKKVVVSRADYVFPGAAKARQIDTLVWAKAK